MEGEKNYMAEGVEQPPFEFGYVGNRPGEPINQIPFRGMTKAAIDAIASIETNGGAELTLEALELEQAMLTERMARFGTLSDPADIWRALGMPDPANIAMLEIGPFIEAAAGRRAGV